MSSLPQSFHVCRRQTEYVEEAVGRQQSPKDMVSAEAVLRSSNMRLGPPARKNEPPCYVTRNRDKYSQPCQLVRGCVVSQRLQPVHHVWIRHRRRVGNLVGICQVPMVFFYRSIAKHGPVSPTGMHVMAPPRQVFASSPRAFKICTSPSPPTSRRLALLRILADNPDRVGYSNPSAFWYMVKALLYLGV